MLREINKLVGKASAWLGLITACCLDSYGWWPIILTGIFAIVSVACLVIEVAYAEKDMQEL